MNNGYTTRGLGKSSPLSMCSHCKEKSVAVYIRKGYRFRRCINRGCSYSLMY